jgi:hypothetical protein
MLRPRDLSIINLPIRLQVKTFVVRRKLKTSKPIVSIYSLLQLLKEQKLFSTFPLIKKIGKKVIPAGLDYSFTYFNAPQVTGINPHFGPVK